MDRRRFLQLVAAVGGSAALSATGYYYLSTPSNGGTTPSNGNGSPPIDLPEGLPEVYVDFLEWLRSVTDPFTGENLEVFLQLEPDYRALNRRNPEFVAASNVTPSYNLRSFVVHRQQTLLSLRTGAPQPDVFNFDSASLSLYKDFLIPPEELAAEYPDLTFPGLNLDDFNSLNMNLGARYPQVLPEEGPDVSQQLYALPFNSNLMVHFYREDLYGSAGLEPPSDWDEYVERSRIIGDAHEDVVGNVSQARPPIPITYEFYNHLYGFGGRFWEVEADGVVPVIDSEEVVDALESFMRLRQVSHPSSFDFTWENVTSSFQTGTVANAVTIQEQAAIVEDPNRSISTGKMAYQRPPAGPAGSFPFYAGDAVGVSKFSSNPGLSWLWLQWATFTGTQVMMTLDPISRYTPSRNSAWNHQMTEDALGGERFDSIRVVREALDSGNLSHEVGFPELHEVRRIIAQRLSQAWQGEVSAGEALRLAQEEVTERKDRFDF